MKRLFFALIFLLNINFSFAELTIEATSEGFSVKLTNISEAMGDRSDGKLAKYLVRNSSNETFKLSLNIALPNYSISKVEYKFGNLKQVQNQLEDGLQFKLDNTFLGVRRGIDIANLMIQPFVQSGGKSYLADSIYIEVKFNSSIKSGKSNFAYSPSFADVINRSQVVAIEEQKMKSNKYPTVMSDNIWYNPDTKYIKISTRNDGIAKINAQSLIEIAPEWNNLSLDGFHLIHNGKDYPIYIYSGSNQLSPTTEILFLGSRAKGDTTWHENYTDKAVFYIYFDAGKTPHRLQLMPDISASKEINDVNINYHIEKDLEYFLGTIDVFSRTDQFEGWYWAKLHRFTHNWEVPLYQFNESFNFIPSSEDIEINYRFRTLNTSLPISGTMIGGLDPKHNFKFNTLLNNDTVTTTDLNKWTDDYVGFTLPGNAFMSGSNSIRVLNRRVDSANGMLGIDYFNIKGKVKPFPIMSSTKFDISPQDENSKLKVGGFANANVVSIDTVSNLIGKYTGSSGYRFVASAGGSSLVAMINDSLARFEGKGLLLAYKNPLGSTVVRNFSIATESNEIISLINSLPNSALITIAYNAPSVLPTSLINSFMSLGSQQAAAFEIGNSWVFACKKGDASKVFESTGSNIASIDGFIAEPNAGSFSIEMKFEANKNYSLFLASENSYEEAIVENVNYSNIRNDNSSAELIIISHIKFWNEAKIIEEYRKSKGVKVRTFDVESIYKEFGYGKKSPHSIKEFLKYAYNNWELPRPQYLLIVGDASWDARKIIKGSKGEDYVPSYGQPVTDFWYGLIDGEDEESELIVGRIPAQDAVQVKNYYDKVVSFENQPNSKWMKKFLFISGGQTQNEKDSFAELRYDVFDRVEPYPFCGDTEWVGLADKKLSLEEMGPKIISNLNNGVIWTHFFGHASSQVFDLDGWHVEYLNNKGRNGFLSTLGCNAGAFAEPLDLHGRNETYLLAKDNGFVATFGTTGVGLVDGARHFMNYMMIGLLDYEIALRKAGDIMNYAKDIMMIDGNGTYKVTRELIQLLGDPMVKIRIGNEPDLFLQSSEININGSGDDPRRPTENDEFVNFSGSFFNNGYAVNQPYRLRVIRTYNAKSDTLFLDYNIICAYQNFTFNLPIADMPGEHTVELYLDPIGFEDFNLADNTFKTKFYVYSQNLIPIDPLANWNVTKKNPTFRLINPLADQFSFEYKFKILTISGQDTNIVVSSNVNQIDIAETHIDWKPEVELEDGQNYFFSYQLNNLSNGVVGYEVFQPFFATDNISNSNLKLTSTEHFNEMSLDNLTSANNSLTIKNPEIDFHILSVNGDPNGEFVSWGRIALGNDVYYDHQYLRGINVVILPKNSDNPKGRYLRFDTWDKLDEAENLIRLLRDTVTENEYIMISNCGQSFRAFVELSPKTGIAYIDSLVVLLESYGATNANELNFNKSYAFFGFKGASPAETFEMINDYDSSFVAGKIKFFGSQGKAISKSFGPAKSWETFSIDGIADENVNNVVKLKFFNDDNSLSFEKEYNSFSNFDISDVPANIYPYSNLEIHLERNDYKAENKINEINLNFRPSPELAIVQSATSLDKPELLRGDTLTATTRVINLSLRSPTENVELEHKFTGISFQNVEHKYILPTIAANSIFDFSAAYGTESLSNEILVSSKIESPIFEMFSFNNTAQSSTKALEDTQKPQAVVTFDGRKLSNGDYITSSPEIVVEVFDNSLLPLTRSTDVLVRINGAMQTVSNTQKYELEQFGYNKPLKLRLTLIPNTLDESDNSVFVYFSDATSNKDTIKYLLKIAKSGKISDHFIYPNPSSDQSKFKFSVRSPRNEGKAIISIYNFTGEVLRELEKEIVIGDNEIAWDNRDKYGNALPTGVYFYTIKVVDTVSFDRVSGKIMILY